MIKTQTRVSKVSFFDVIPWFLFEECSLSSLFSLSLGALFCSSEACGTYFSPFLCFWIELFTKQHAAAVPLWVTETVAFISSVSYLPPFSSDFNCLSSHFYLGKNPDGWRISTLFERAEKKDRGGEAPHERKHEWGGERGKNVSPAVLNTWLWARASKGQVWVGSVGYSPAGSPLTALLAVGILIKRRPPPLFFLSALSYSFSLSLSLPFGPAQVLYLLLFQWSRNVSQQERGV